MSPPSSSARWRAITGFLAPAMTGGHPLTRLAEMSGDADSDRSLSPRCDE